MSLLLVVLTGWLAWVVFLGGCCFVVLLRLAWFCLTDNTVDTSDNAVFIPGVHDMLTPSASLYDDSVHCFACFGTGHKIAVSHPAGRPAIRRWVACPGCGGSGVLLDDLGDNPLSHDHYDDLGIS